MHKEVVGTVCVMFQVGIMDENHNDKISQENI